MNEEVKKYSIIDIETTGASSRGNKITEIAIINMDGDKIVESFSSLIFPERGIPAQIQSLTGISNEMVADAPRFYELAKKIVQMTEGRVFVAHNAHFDYSFIQNEFRELGYTFKRERLCTVRLARKILPGFASYSLGKLCDEIGIEIKGRHRAMGDAKATAKLFQMIQERKSEHFQEIYNSLNDKINFPPYFNKSDYEVLPKAPGVYYLWDKEGQLLYIGKAKEIKKRVRQHFDVKSSRAKEFAFKNNIAGVSFEELGNELAALLFEANEIKKRSPLFNRALRRKYFPWSVTPFIDQSGVLNFRASKVKDDEAPLRCGSKRLAQASIKRIYHQAFGIEPSVELMRSHELETMLKALGLEEYNRRLETKYQELTFPQDNFKIKLPGRKVEEYCLIKRYVGKGLHITFEIDGNEVDRFTLNETPDMVQIILQYLRKNEIKPIEI